VCLGRLSRLQQLQARLPTRFSAFLARSLGAGLAGEIVTIEDEVWGHPKVFEQPDAVHDEIDIFASRLALGELYGASHGATVKPTIPINS
jgi:hypothetical protein